MAINMGRNILFNLIVDNHINIYAATNLKSKGQELRYSEERAYFRHHDSPAACSRLLHVRVLFQTAGPEQLGWIILPIIRCICPWCFSHFRYLISY